MRSKIKICRNLIFENQASKNLINEKKSPILIYYFYDLHFNIYIITQCLENKNLDYHFYLFVIIH